MSDIASSSRIDDAEVVGAVFSRLANTNGTMLIESPPRRPSGMIYKIYEMSKLRKNIDANSSMSQFKIHEIPALMAVDAAERLNKQIQLLPEAAGELLGIENFETKLDPTIPRSDPNKKGPSFTNDKGERFEQE